MRIFVHSLDGESRKWFRDFPLEFIDEIEALDDSFLRQWGDKKDFFYYITEFGSLKRKEGESVSDFSQRFNKMYNNIPHEINPIETSTKITYASAFDPNFFLLLRERIFASLAHMQDVVVEVEYSIVAYDQIRGKYDKDGRKSITKDSTYDSSIFHSQVDEITKLVKSLSVEMENIKFEGKKTYRNTKIVDNKGGLRRPNNAPQTLIRDPRNRERDDQKI
jgi:hypothetical protein